MEQETLRGEVIRWRTEPKESTGWHIIELRDLDERTHAVTGCNLPRPGSTVELRGTWESHPRYGAQFFTREVVSARPALSAEGVKRWLMDRCDGIGAGRAGALLEAFGGDARALWAALEQGPERLTPTVGAELAQHIHETYAAEGVSREHYATLRGLKLTQAQIARVIRHWPIAEACQKINADPYLLSQHISGFGFKRADAVAIELGIKPQAPERVRAAVLHHLDEYAGAGHVFGNEAFFYKVAGIIDVPISRVIDGIKQLREAGLVVVDSGTWIYLRELHTDELTASAEIVRSILGSADRRPKHVEVTYRPGFERDARQEEAIDLLCDTRMRIGFITGGPGTGKTSVLKYALDTLDTRGVRYVLAAPTGKAAKRMTQATGRRAMTLHSLLQYRAERWTDCEQCKAASSDFHAEPLGEQGIDLVVVDEASMVDVRLWAALARTTCEHTYQRSVALRFVGDADQLPPVGPGQPFQDALATLEPRPTERERFVVRLERPRRQGAGSWVANAAPLVLAGKVPELTDTPDFRFFDVDRADQVLTTLQRMYAGTLDDAVWSARCVRPLHITARGVEVPQPAPVLIPQRTGAAGTLALNRYLLELNVPLEPGEQPVCIELEGGNVLREGAWVMCTKNDYQRRVRNGDTGVITAIETKLDKQGRERVERVHVELDDPEPEQGPVPFSAGQAREQLQLAYATTIHKSQGSQYPWVIVVCHSSHARMLTRRLLYTAITRAQEGLVLIGDREGIARAIGNTSEVKRNTKLPERLTAGLRVVSLDTDNGGGYDGRVLN